MYIYIIKREEENICYHENSGHVIVAHDEAEVVALAKRGKAQEPESAWDHEDVIIENIGSYIADRKDSHIIMTTFIDG